MIRDLRADREHGVHGESEAHCEDCLKYFGSVTTTMLSLFMSISNGVSWEDVLQPLRMISEVWVGVYIMHLAWHFFE